MELPAHPLPHPVLIRRPKYTTSKVLIFWPPRPLLPLVGFVQFPDHHLPYCRIQLRGHLQNANRSLVDKLEELPALVIGEHGGAPGDELNGGGERWLPRSTCPSAWSSNSNGSPGTYITPVASKRIAGSSSVKSISSTSCMGSTCCSGWEAWSALLRHLQAPRFPEMTHNNEYYP